MQKLLESFTPLERKVWGFVKNHETLSSIVSKSGLKDIEVLRALGWLEDKKIITTEKDASERIVPGKNGLVYLKKGLPEKRFLIAIEKESLDLEEIKAKADLDDNEAGVSLGVLKKRNAVEIGKKIKITEHGRELLKKGFAEEEFLKKLPMLVKGLAKEDEEAYNRLKGRKEIIENELVKEIKVSLTGLGSELKKHKLEIELLEGVTTNILKTGAWKSGKFRRYNINAEVPKMYAGRVHFTNEALKYIRRIWVEMGFKEMDGSLVQTSFWNFDALFTAQDHPVREMQDTFFIKNPGNGKLPDGKLVEKVRKVHEHGGETGSLGWGGKWNPEEAKKNVLRTHTTALSAKTIYALKKDELPAKYFSVGKCFRNETLDWSHLFEFDQTEGIVIDENANFRHLLGYLKEFFNKMGFEKVRFRPAYFPYTEPSIEVDVFHPKHKKWIELGGAGMFRPEVVVPLLGKDVPVLAWGLGVGRILADYYNINDIRELYKNDLKQLREIKAWVR